MATQLSTRFSTLDQLICDNNPFFEGLLPLPDDMGPFFNKFLSTEGKIFETCTITWPLLRKVIVKEHWNIASVLEGQPASQISEETTREVAEAMTTAEGVRVQVDWIDKEIDRSSNLKIIIGSLNADQMKEQIEGVQRKVDGLVGELKWVEEEMLGQGIDTASSKKYIVHFFDS